MIRHVSSLVSLLTWCRKLFLQKVQVWLSRNLAWIFKICAKCWNFERSGWNFRSETQNTILKTFHLQQLGCSLRLHRVGNLTKVILARNTPLTKFKITTWPRFALSQYFFWLLLTLYKMCILFFIVLFTAQCTLVHLRGLAIACRLSVRLSVRPSVTLVISDHIDWKSWKLIAWAISPTSSLFAAKRRSTYSQGNMEKFWGD